MRRAKVDGNHAEIVAALRQAGASVQSLATIGHGCPDLLVGIGGHTALLEVKAPKGRVTPDQHEWHGSWRGGTLAVVDSPEAALRVIGVMRNG